MREPRISTSIYRLPRSGLVQRVFCLLAPPADVPHQRHQSVSVNLTGLLWAYLKQHRIGRVFSAPFDVVFSTMDVVEPDLLYVSNARRAAVLTERHVAGAPDLVVEIKSPSTGPRDAGLKRRLYERFGVSEYWLVDPKAHTIAVYRQGNAGFCAAIKLERARGDESTSPLFPGLTLSLVEIFETD